MALFASTDENYTKTGNGALTRWANGLSFVPYVRNIPLLGTTITGVLGFADTIWETSRWLFRGELGSALTVAAAGTVGTAVNAISATPFWWANAASGATTGASLGTHARAGVETVVKALGFKPTVLQDHFAGIGSVGSGMAPQGPGKFAAGVSAQRGENADAAYARYMNSEESRVHVNQLGSAYGRGA